MRGLVEDDVFHPDGQVRHLGALIDWLTVSEELLDEILAWTAQP